MRSLNLIPRRRHRGLDYVGAEDFVKRKNFRLAKGFDLFVIQRRVLWGIVGLLAG